jgi:benzoate/toluate 1,2-dioxygenase reductase subunit
MYATTIVGLRSLSEATFELSLRRPPSFEFTPGQYVSLTLDGERREYTVISAPSARTLDFCIRATGGGFTSRLAGVRRGAPIGLSGPKGYFTYRHSRRRAVFAATGTGIAPFVSYARAGVTGYVLLHGVRNRRELYYRDLLSSRALAYVPCLSGTPDDALGPGARGLSRGASVEGRAAPGASTRECRGRLTAYMVRRLDRGVYDFYLCGRSDMIVDAVKIIDERFPGSFVYTEPFF